MTTSSVTSKIWVGIILIVACMGAGFFANKFYHGYSDAMSRSKQLNQQSSELNQGSTKTDIFLAGYLDKKSDAKLLNLALPAHDSDIINFMANVAQSAQQSGVSLSGFQITEPAQDKAVDNSIQSMELSLSGRGSYPSLKDFLLRLETSLRLIDITHLTLTADENANLQYQMTIKTYYQK